MQAPRPSAGILVCGGSFDPPHRAHIELTRAAGAVLRCARVVMVPANVNPLKTETPPTDGRHRLAMLNLALRAWHGRPEVTIDTFELDHPPPSYSVDTLEHIRQISPPDARLHLLMGSDAASEFHRWKNVARILELATPAVLLRPPHTAESFHHALAAHWPAEDLARWRSWLLPLPTIDMSASQIRRAVADQNWGLAEKLVGPDVLGYIRAQGLYRAATPPGSARGARR